MCVCMYMTTRDFVINECLKSSLILNISLIDKPHSQ